MYEGYFNDRPTQPKGRVTVYFSIHCYANSYYCQSLTFNTKER